MQGKGRRLRFPLIVLLVVAVLAIRWFGPFSDSTEEAKNTSEVSELAAKDVRVYLPPLPSLTFFFAGEGMEFASFTRKITFSDPQTLQIEDSSGTNLAQVVEVTAEQLRIVWAEEEFYEEKNLLDEGARQNRQGGAERDLILLQAPISPGHSWSDESFQREIIATDETVTVPLGTFYEVVVVKNRSLAADNFVTYEYYAKNIGLIKRVSVAESGDDADDFGVAYAIVSSLSRLVGPPSPR